MQFVVLTTIAMQVYAGGTIWNPWAPGYAFDRNFLVTSLSYVVLVLAYVGIVAYAVRHGTWTEREHRVLVLTQKAMAYVSMVYVAFVTYRVRRNAAMPART